MNGNCSIARARVSERTVTTAGATLLTTGAYEPCCGAAAGWAAIVSAGADCSLKVTSDKAATADRSPPLRNMAERRIEV